MYKRQALARANAGIAKGLIARCNSDDIWKVTKDIQVDDTASIAEEPTQVVDAIEPEFTKEEEEDNPQLEEDREFLASLMSKIDPEEEKTVPVQEQASEEKAPVTDNVPDFDDDEFMFSS